MKGLVLCSPQLGISPQSNSGGEVYDHEVVSQLCQKGIKVKTLLPKNRDYPSLPNLKVDYAAIKPMVPPYIFNFFVFPYLLKTYKKEKFQILRIHSPYFVGPAAVLFKKLYPKVPLIASYLHLEEGNIVYSLIDKLLIKKFDHLITISQATKKEIMKKYSISLRNISIAYPGVSSHFKPQRKSQQLIEKYQLKNKKILLFLGGLKERKNPLFLLKVIKTIKDRDLALLIAGEGPLKKKMILTAENLEMKNQVIFTGFVKEKQKVKYYNLADIVLLPSKKEGFGMIATEAGACGIPVIASSNSSLPEIIKNGKTGFLAETNSLDDWREKIILLLKNKNLQRKMGSRAEKYVREKFSWEKNAQKHLKVFKKLLKR